MNITKIPHKQAMKSLAEGKINQETLDTMIAAGLVSQPREFRSRVISLPNGVSVTMNKPSFIDKKTKKVVKESEWNADMRDIVRNAISHWESVSTEVTTTVTR